MSQGTVVIVDDDPILCHSLSSLIATRGYIPCSFYTGQKLLDWLLPDEELIILIDINMRDMNGLQVLAAMRKSNCNQPAIFITGHSSSALKKCANAIGATAFLEKPFRSDDLFAAISEGFLELADLKIPNSQGAIKFGA